RGLFVALPGERVDGHDFVATALSSGAGAAMVQRTMSDADGSLVIVDDCRLALGRLAGHWRERFDIPVLGITGSNGKTTVKNMLAAIVGRRAAVMSTPGNFNNEIGLPLTLMTLGEEHRYAVVELGANHLGEIAHLAAMAGPQVGVITQCAPAHIEGFGSIRNVVKAKGELVEALHGDGSVAVLNADDEFFSYWKERSNATRVLSFGACRTADVRGEWQVSETGVEITVHWQESPFTVHLGLLGQHNVMNALAAAAAAFAVQCDREDVVRGLSGVKPAPGRLEFHQTNCGTRIIDDSYNANPRSVKAAVDAMALQPGPHWLVMGEMAELGDVSDASHRAIGTYAKSHGVKRLLTLGGQTAHTCDAFGAGAQNFLSFESMLEELNRSFRSAGTILVKGSRSSRMERIVNVLLKEAA
ncbi:MAG: UDP-N-acetylmuramoyl-tripeptide--D-alanyl-D-alanine ligase, partial [Chromatiales bacterium]|nr:UDP-N-acetylmuramoyl-tripeptide--D-alanyl-D-alanine ligase [Chromatiales bacterium]